MTRRRRVSRFGDAGARCHDAVMRTTLDIDDAVLSAARAKARAEGISVGKAVSDLARQALEGGHVDKVGGFPVLKGVPVHVVTDELVSAYRDDD